MLTLLIHCLYSLMFLKIHDFSFSWTGRERILVSFAWIFSSITIILSCYSSLLLFVSFFPQLNNLNFNSSNKLLLCSCTLSSSFRYIFTHLKIYEYIISSASYIYNGSISFLCFLCTFFTDFPSSHNLVHRQPSRWKKKLFSIPL